MENSLATFECFYKTIEQKILWRIKALLSGRMFFLKSRRGRVSEKHFYDFLTRGPGPPPDRTGK
jgi:hypothetical protein